MSKITGSVKWYDTKKGYGFITVLTPGDENLNNDIFVHFSNVNVEDGYRRLFPGEYVEFEMGESEDGRTTCLNVTGLYGGNLLCQNSDHRFRVFPKRKANGSVEVDEDDEDDEDDESVEVSEGGN